MADKKGEDLPIAGICSSKRSENSDERLPTFLKTPSIRSSVYSESFAESEQLGKATLLSQTIGEKIRSSLPNIGHHLRRFMKLKSQRELKDEESTAEVSLGMSSLNNNNLTDIALDAEDHNDENATDLFENQDFQLSESNFNEHQVVSSIPSTSASLSQPQTSDFSIESDFTISGINGQPVAPTNRTMVSSAVEASLDDSSDQLTLGDIVTEEGAIIAGDPLNFAAALNAQLGYDRIRTYAELQARREHEPRSVPLLLFQDSARDSFLGSSTSGINGSSISGSEDGSVNGVSEVVEDVTEESSALGRRSDERDQAQQYYDAAHRAAVRKQFRHLDDEPPIY